MQKGVLLVNLGSPTSPSPNAVRDYLYEFLLDKKVLDLPFFMRHLLVRGVIVPRRYKQSAKSYQQIWTNKGSPLLVYSSLIESSLQKELADIEVRVAMRYQKPSIVEALSAFQEKKVKDLLLFPLFPQYAEATTGSVVDKVFRELRKLSYAPRVQLVSHFATESFFIDSFYERIRSYPLHCYDHFLFSFHGLPIRQLRKRAPQFCGKEGNICCQSLCHSNRNCYAAQCYATMQALVNRLNLHKDQYSIAFQSRLGKEPWIEPYTTDVLEGLIKRDKKRVLVICPSFIADCLETLYEIGEEYRHLFLQMGGETLDFAQSLNDHPLWLEGLKGKILSCFHPSLSGAFCHQSLSVSVT